MRTLTRRTGRLAPLCLLIAVMAACGGAGASRLREAQEAFNDGAALENRDRLLLDIGEIDAQEAAGLMVGSKAHYRQALHALKEIGAEEEKALRADGLWVTARTLEALCRWKLGEHDAAIAVARDALVLADSMKEPRDRALLLALPGLVKNDQAFAKIPVKRMPDAAAFTEVRNLLVAPRTGALSDIGAARTEAAGRPVDLFLIQSGLAACKNLLDAYGNLAPTLAEPNASDRAEMKAFLVALRDHLEKRGVPNPSAHELYRRWRGPFTNIPRSELE